ncbi:hypothetical protein FAM09_27540 [Niastella caeni]|uniref:Uncharacterized protein n=1 Tax=Niastella caeni TaxID=2569763 RepID=A0A4V4GZG7_9BACT|nr:hypothetical protein [Niastella caeni]THU32546.1 hypothetical protein FAM09_27540 [Niastella caeni]
MNHIIREKRKLIFNGRIITPTIIRQLAKLFEEESFKPSDDFEKVITTIYSIDADDNSSYESQSTQIFESGEMIEKKVVTRINMRLNTFDNSKNIELQLSDSLKDDSTTNFILVSGEDTIWVNGITAKFNEVLNQSQKQVKAISFTEYCAFLAIIIFNIIYFRLFYSSFEKMHSDFYKLIFIVGIPIVSMIGFSNLGDYLKGLWPSVELQTGPGYLQIPMLKRKKLSWILSVIIIPLLLGFIYDILKSFFHIF